MRRNLLGSLSILLTSAGLSFAQTPIVTFDSSLPVASAEAEEKASPRDAPPPGAVKPNPALPAAPSLTGDSCCPEVDCCIPYAECGPRFWASGEYLLWWFKSSPDPVPLLTTAPASSPALIPGVLGNPDTTILLGGNHEDTNLHQGGGFTIGYWLDNEASVGVEANYFFIGQKNITRSVNQNGSATSLPTFIPFFSLLDGGTESSASVNVPGSFVGFSSLTMSNQLQGAELNGLANLQWDPNLHLDLVGGFRYWQLDEGLTFSNFSPSLTGIGGPGSYVDFDSFTTHNRFWGGQIGARAEYQFGGIFINTTAKIALGDMHEIVEIAGSNTSTFVAGAPVTSAGGAFAQPTNMGRFSSDHFAVLPEVNLNVGYQYGSVRAFIGYTFQYASDVVHPGDQIERRRTRRRVPCSTVLHLLVL